jgi:hypothetical protein
MPKTRKGGRKGGVGMLSNLMGKTQKTKDKDQRINESWEQSSKDQKDWEERRVAEAATNVAAAEKAAAAEKKALTARKRAATLAAKKSDAKAAAEAKEKAILNDRVKSAIRRLTEIESLWKWNTDLARKLSLRTVGFQTTSEPAPTGAAHEAALKKDMLAPANEKLTIIQAKKAALSKSLEGNNTSTNPRGGRTKKRHYKHPKKGRKSRTHKGRKSRTHKRR